MTQARFFIVVLISSMSLVMVGCSSKKEMVPHLFTVLHSEQTGLEFSNNLNYTPEFNLFKYMYFYNGSGIGAGDFNNDGKVDLFFGSNQGQNKLFLNTGNLKFKDFTAEANIPD
ncbi:VCBS repeat-containing protein, partial [Xanthomonas citri pv. citri]